MIDLRWKSRLWLDFKIESVLIASFIISAVGQEKENNSKFETGQGDY